MTPAEARQAQRTAILTMTERLISDYAQSAPAGRVISTASASLSRLHGQGLRDDRLLLAVEELAREQLNEWVVRESGSAFGS